jgi:hypothetical protein
LTRRSDFARDLRGNIPTPEGEEPDVSVAQGIGVLGTGSPIGVAFGTAADSLFKPKKPSLPGEPTTPAPGSQGAKDAAEAAARAQFAANQARRGRSANYLSGPGGAGASGAGTRQLLGVG